MRVIETALEEDLSAFARYLRQHRVPHRIFEERGVQVVEAGSPEAAQAVRAAYGAWRRGELPLQAGDASPQAGVGGARAVTAIARFPALTVLCLLALLVAPFSTGLVRADPFVAGLFFVDPYQRSLGPLEVFATFELWRWVTPILLHFSAVHLLFNIAVTVEFGRRIEFRRGAMGFLGIVLVTAVVSNFAQYLAQYLAGDPAGFGGLSGVAYGLLGYVVISQRRQPEDPVWQVHKGFVGSLLVFLVVFSTGVTEAFLPVANAAHWGGLITGAALALLPSPSADGAPVS
ncbi:MAG: rhomboid family intramembrane serine protease [Pseudomonadota bacterium]